MPLAKWNFESKDNLIKWIVPDGDFVHFPEFANPIQKAVMPIIALADEKLIAVGTGFTIGADGYMITAAHVVEEFGQPRVAKRDGSGYYNNISLYALHITDKRHGPENKYYMGGLWPIYKAHFVPGLDIAVCSLQEAKINGEKYTFPSVKLSFKPPKVGEYILCCGYYKSGGEVTIEKLVANYSQNNALSKGKVVEVFFPRRDLSAINWPCFHITARIEGGMSGGPVFNESGSVCGVMCRSFAEPNDQGEYTSYCSTLWPALGTLVEVKFSPDGPVETIPLYDMVKKGAIPVDETFDQINFIMNPDGSRSISAPHWLGQS